ncbi:MAG: polysaccharide deacetylase family protein [Candidatus Methanoperedens sp.]|nr:polysaccharide deacetylase family protein [Candidatus Methanoperedens sp.]
MKWIHSILESANEFNYLIRGRYANFVTSIEPKWMDTHLPIFTWHGVEPDEFDEELSFLSENGYSTWTLCDFYKFQEGVKPTNDRHVMITFDDGYESVWTVGGQILKKYGFQAVAFVTPTYIGQPGYLSWDQVSRMHESGFFDIQSHTLTHRAMIVRQPADRLSLEFELAESKRIIESHLPYLRVDCLCYPYGLGSDEAVALSKKTGYRANFWSGRADRSLNRPGDDPYYVVRLKHDYVFRLPGRNRKNMATIFSAKFFRRLRGKAYA